ncbi:MAG: 3-deoxy-7-phosphoheptulonate synthase class II [Deltaproteobacteria bacterium]|nr:3-deoxy-7-phosphoheptulonate synthase class II [Deltaproteobacteria bacterium]
MTWKPDSWKSKRISQIPSYPDMEHLERVQKKIASYPPLVFIGEVDQLKKKLIRVSQGDAFLLHGGDCAESFSDLNTQTVQNNFRILLQMSVVLTFALKKYVVKLGRTAGQFAKPRSSQTETKGNVTLPSYRGDIINGYEFSEKIRQPNPKRMERAYFHSAATLNTLRALARGGFANLGQVQRWNLDFAEQNSRTKRYKHITERVQESLSFMKAMGIDDTKHSQLRGIEFYTSHEALLLPYEEALTKLDTHSESPHWYDCSAHYLWIGDRTRQLDSAHVEFARGICNPIGIKCSSSLTPDDLIKLIDVLNPKNEHGRLTLITRFGHQKIAEYLPPLIQKVSAEGRHVVWCCDPMHGNTHTASNGYKTRHFQDILDEAQQFLAIHKNEGTYAGGVHFEMTGSNVVECIGSDQAIEEEHLSRGFYQTLCDPRLNADQALELAFKLI